MAALPGTLQPRLSLHRLLEWRDFDGVFLQALIGDFVANLRRLSFHRVSSSLLLLQVQFLLSDEGRAGEHRRVFGVVRVD